MTENVQPPVDITKPVIAAPPAVPAYGAAPAVPAYGSAPVHASAGTVPLGKIRGTGVAILLSIITFGIYSVVWTYKVHKEMKEYSGQGLGGGLALVLQLVVGIVMPFITPSEVANLYKRAGKEAPVSGATGLWYFPGIFILIGPIVWFVKTNGAINAFWRSEGVS